MMFNFNKTVEIHCYTYNKFIADNFCVQEMKTTRPSWFKNLPKKSEKKSTMKSCYGFINLFKKGFVFPFWTDIEITNTIEELVVNYANQDTTNVLHHLNPNNSSAETLSPQHRHAQIQPPWVFTSDKLIEFAVVGASWDYINNNLYDFHLPTGIIDFKYNNTINVQMLFPKPTGNQRQSNIIFKAGDPILYLIPLTEKKVKFITHNITRMEYYDMIDNVDSKSHFFSNKYVRSRTYGYKGYMKE